MTDAFFCLSASSLAEHGPTLAPGPWPRAARRIPAHSRIAGYFGLPQEIPVNVYSNRDKSPSETTLHSRVDFV
jgi:hypothetical protein